MNPKQQRAYEESLRAHKKALSLAYKLGGGRLNDPPRRSQDRAADALRKILRERGSVLDGGER